MKDYTLLKVKRPIEVLIIKQFYNLKRQYFLQVALQQFFYRYSGLLKTRHFQLKAKLRQYIRQKNRKLARLNTQRKTKALSVQKKLKIGKTIQNV